jgi:myo-inositol 2-dehydrogenase/D-chiro-inositol 1-dehydrogenase
MIAEAEFDVAVVCSPPFLHLEQVQMLASAGIPTLCEKPLAITEAEAQAIKNAAERSEALVMVAHQSRHQSTYSEISAALAAGEIGEVRSAFMEWSFTLDPGAPNARWKQDPALNGPSCLTDAAIHCFDAAIGVFGPGRVTGASSPGRSESGVFETCDVLSLHGGVEVAVRASRLYGPYSNMLVISGTKGEIHAPHFFTEASAPIMWIDGVDGPRTIERLPGSPYREEVEDFVRTAFVPGHISVGTSLEQAVVACRMLDEAHALL